MRLKLLLALLIVGLLPQASRASHMLGGEFHWRQRNATQFDLYFVLYRDRSGLEIPQSVAISVIDSLAGGCTQVASFAMPFLTSEAVAKGLGCTALTSLPNYGASKRIFYSLLTLPGNSIYKIRMTGNARPSVTNLAQGTNLVVNALIDNRFAALNHSFAGSPFQLVEGKPEFELLNIGCLNEMTVIRQPVTDPDGDSLAYELVSAYSGLVNTTAECAARALYSIIPKPVNYAGPGIYTPQFPIYSYKQNTNGVFEPYFELDRRTGVIALKPSRHVTVTRANQPDNKYVYVVRVKEYRRINGVMRLISYRDRNRIMFVEVCSANSTSPSAVAVQNQEFQPDSVITLSTDSVIRASPSVCAFPTYRLRFRDPDTADLVSVEPMLLNYFRISTRRSADSLELEVLLRPRPDSLYNLARKAAMLSFIITVQDRGCPFPRSTNITFEISPYVTPSPLRQTSMAVCGPATLTSRVVYRDSVLWILPNGTRIKTRGPDLPNMTLSGEYRSRSVQDVCFHEDTTYYAIGSPPLIPNWPSGMRPICQTDTLLTRPPTGPGTTYDLILPNKSRIVNFTSYRATASGIYVLEANNGYCKAYDTLVINFQQLPTPNLGVPRNMCPNQILGASGVTAPLNQTIVWTAPDGRTAVGTNIRVTVSGIYTATLGDGRCSRTSSVNITVLPIADPDVPRTVSVCASSYVLSATQSAGHLYSWRLPTNQVVQGAVITATTSGRYILSSRFNTCTRFDTVIVSLLSTPSFTLASRNVTVCDNSTPAPLVANITSGTPVWQLPDGRLVYNFFVVPVLPGIYRIVVSNGSCEKRDSVMVDQATAPLKQNLPRILFTCSTSVQLNLKPEPGVTYRVRLPNGQSIFDTIVNASQSGSYVIYAQRGNCFTMDTVSLTVQAQLSVLLGPDRAICPNLPLAPIGITPTQNPVSWELPGGGTATGPSVWPNASGRYIATVTDGPCRYSDTVNVTFLPVPASQQLPDTMRSCQNRLTIAISREPGSTYSYIMPTGLSSSLVINLNARISGRYIIKADNGICVRSDTVIVVLGDQQAPELPTSLRACTQVRLRPGVPLLPGTRVNWLLPDGSSLQLDSMLALASGRYVAQLNFNNCVVTDTVQVTIDSLPPAPVVPALDFACVTSIPLTVTNAVASVSYSWLLPNLTTLPGPDYVATTSGRYILRSVRGSCLRLDTFQIDLLPLPVLSLGPDTGFCATGLNLVPRLTGAPVSSYAWQGPNGFSSNASTIVTAVAGQYILRVQTALGCTAVDTVNLAAYVLPQNPVLPDSVKVCDVQAALAVPTIEPGIAYSWTSPMGQVTPATTVIATISGRWKLTASNSRCSIERFVQVVLHPLPSLDLAADTGYCASPITIVPRITGAPAASYNWQGPNGFTSTAPSLSVFTVGKYRLTIATANGCLATDTVSVVSYPVPAAPIVPDSIKICATQVRLSVTNPEPGLTYDWTAPNGQVFTGPSIQANSSGTWLATARNAFCSASTPVKVVLYALPQISLGNDTGYCSGGLNLVPASAGAPVLSYDWRGPGGFTSTVASIMGATAGQYILTVTSEGGCTMADTLDIVEYAKPARQLTRRSVAVCAADTLLQTYVVQGQQYGWRYALSDAVTPGPELRIDRSGLYILQISNVHCQTYDSLWVQLTNVLKPAMGADQRLCQPTTLTIPAQQDVVYNWTGPAGLGVGPVIPLNAAGTYVVTGSLNNCQTHDTLEVELVEPEEVPIRFRLNGYPVEGELSLPLRTTLAISPGVEVDSTRWLINGKAATGSEVSLTIDQPGPVVANFQGTRPNQCRIYGSGQLMVKAFLVPNFISPNGDGRNDQFEFAQISPDFPASLTITNRWGQQVFHSDSYDNRWDGGDLPSGTYFYFIEIRNLPASLGQYKGWLQILK